jgi:O-antigen/teichoic acid export membrane protein
MPQNSTQGQVAKNTLVLYVRQLLILGINLYTVRATLDALGAEDYGLYNVVASIVMLSSFLSATMASATQRFFSFALGEGDHQKLAKIFSVNCMIYGGIAVLAVVLLESAGLWFVNHHLQTPPARAAVVSWIYQYSIVMFVASIFATLYVAIIIAHENMRLYAYVSLLEAAAKLGVALAISHASWDRLQLYGLLMCGTSVATTLIYTVGCGRLYPECRFRRLRWDGPLFRDIVRFTSWTLFGQLTTVGRSQAITILLNQAFTPIVVVARVIAVTVATQVNMFASNFNVGLYPAIVKSYASKRFNEMHSMVFFGCKATFFLTWALSLPMLLEMEVILKLWLRVPPPDAVLFTRLALTESIIMVIGLPIGTAARATGDMKRYELTLGSIQVAIFLGAWLVLSVGAPAHAVFWVAIALNVVMFYVRLLVVKGTIQLDLGRYTRSVVLPVLTVATLSGAVSLAIDSALPNTVPFSLLTVASSVVSSSLLMYAFGLTRNERVRVSEFLARRLRKVKRIV